MANTEHIGLQKFDDTEIVDNVKVNANYDKLDEEVFKRGKAINGILVDENGEFKVNSVPFAENLLSDDAQVSRGTYITRTSGGDASIADGDAWLVRFLGTREYIVDPVTEVLDMTVEAIQRVAPSPITAVIDYAAFIEEAEEPGTYEFIYTTGWSANPASFGITVSNTPISGDLITVSWDGENNPVMTVVPAPRQADDPITATLDRDTFISYVNASAILDFYYTTAWSADLSLYGITVTGNPLSGDHISVVYVKEDRGVIEQSSPTGFVSTGWNLFDLTNARARTLKYSEFYGFKIGGSYTSVSFVESITDTPTPVTVVNGNFDVPTDGWVLVTGADATTYVYMTWSDWTDEPLADMEAYTESEIDLTAVMTNFPYGLLQAGTVHDEINLNTLIATSNVERLAYTAENLAIAEQSGRTYEVDRDNIYLERAVPVTYTIVLDGAYTVSDHGIEFITGTDVHVETETLYGQNLKDKLRREVLTISQQTLSASQQAQARTNIDAASQSDVTAISSKIEVGTRVSCASLDAIKTLITNYANNIGAGGTQRISFLVDYTASSPILSGQIYQGIIYKARAGLYQAIVYTNTGADLCIGNSDGTWSISSLNDNIAKKLTVNYGYASIGLTSSATVNQIFTAMPDNSKFITGMNNGDKPAIDLGFTSGGIIEITKSSAYRGYAIATSYDTYGFKIGSVLSQNQIFWKTLTVS